MQYRCLLLQAARGDEPLCNQACSDGNVLQQDGDLTKSHTSKRTMDLSKGPCFNLHRAMFDLELDDRDACRGIAQTALFFELSCQHRMVG